MSDVPRITLNNGTLMPQLGFGLWQVPDEEATAAVREALAVGYRSIDTAAAYHNETGTGRALAESGLAREELFVTTKLWNSEHGYDSTLRAFDASLAKLGLEYVDLYLIHWPLPMFDAYVDTWRAMEELYADGRAKAIGVSNFHPEQLRRLLEEGSVTPALNQVELHPNLQQSQLRAFHLEHSIATEAWSPLGQGKDILKNPVVSSVAAKHGRTPAQVILRWHLQLGNVVIPKSVTPSRIQENFDVFDFSLDPEDLEAFEKLDTGTRLGPNPDTNDFRG